MRRIVLTGIVTAVIGAAALLADRPNGGSHGEAPSPGYVASPSRATNPGDDGFGWDIDTPATRTATDRPQPGDDGFGWDIELPAVHA
jgi:hypothetical protein